jgi:hypothetical protein
MYAIKRASFTLSQASGLPKFPRERQSPSPAVDTDRARLSFRRLFPDFRRMDFHEQSKSCNFTPMKNNKSVSHKTESLFE